MAREQSAPDEQLIKRNFWSMFARREKFFEAKCVHEQKKRTDQVPIQ